ncbi:dehydrogenase/reductase SDR family member 11-like [Antennarius striatus]|uniref:dehydrogenase/reductase SDR family member 11-like n=1 Tax=Antennarius striatus TaxID=241820 RepID=UPI0035B23449
MDRWRGRVALVTGASSGIGESIAKELVRYGMKVMGCARNVEKVQKLAAECQSEGLSGVLVPFQCDLSDEEDILSMFAAIKEQHKGVDVCINNAACGHSEPLLSGQTSAWKNMLDVNILGLCICIREAYQSMKERNVDDGHIININGMSGHRVANNASAHFYCSTKFAVTALTEGLRQELQEMNSHIRASSVSPGLVKTELARNLEGSRIDEYSKFKMMKAIDVANSVVYALSAPPHVQIGDIMMQPVEK